MTRFLSSFIRSLFLINNLLLASIWSCYGSNWDHLPIEMKHKIINDNWVESCTMILSSTSLYDEYKETTLWKTCQLMNNFGLKSREQMLLSLVPMCWPLDVIEFLINDEQMPRKYMHGALAIAAQNAQRSCVALLLKKLDRPRDRNAVGKAFLRAMNSGAFRLASTIHQHLLNISPKPYSSNEQVNQVLQRQNQKQFLQSAIRHAFVTSNNEAFGRLHRMGADLHFRREWLLRRAIIDENNDLAEFLIDRGANVNIMNGRPLFMAAQDANWDLVDYLLENGANVHAFDDSALLSAVHYDELAAVHMLLIAGADPNARNGAPLRTALTCNGFHVFQLLLNYNANPNISPYMLFEMALTKTNFNYLKLLIQHGLNISGFPALKMAVQKQHLAAVKLILSQGVNVRLNYEEALREACKLGNKFIVSLLVKSGADVFEAAKAAITFDEATLVLPTLIELNLLENDKDGIMLKMAIECNSTGSIELLIRTFSIPVHVLQDSLDYAIALVRFSAVQSFLKSKKVRVEYEGYRALKHAILSDRRSEEIVDLLVKHCGTIPEYIVTMLLSIPHSESLISMARHKSLQHETMRQLNDFLDHAQNAPR